MPFFSNNSVASFKPNVVGRTADLNLKFSRLDDLIQHSLRNDAVLDQIFQQPVALDFRQLDIDARPQRGSRATSSTGARACLVPTVINWRRMAEVISRISSGCHVEARPMA